MEQITTVAVFPITNGPDVTVVMVKDTTFRVVEDEFGFIGNLLTGEPYIFTRASDAVDFAMEWCGWL